MKKFKGTTGKMSIIYGSTIVDEHGFGIADLDEIQIDMNWGEKGASHWGDEGFNREVSEDEVKANAELIVDAFNTIQDCDRLPRELLAERNELLGMVKELNLLIIDNENENEGDFYDNCKVRIMKEARQLIKRFE